MDPLSALMLSGVLAMLVTKTGAAAVTDVAAAKRKQTPPSLEKWRARQEKRRNRGDPAETDPGPWKRRWRNAVEERNQKAAQKHQARMEYLRDNGRSTVDKHKQRMQRSADRREKVAATVAAWGASSWEKSKQAAQNAREDRAERRAWKANTRHDRENQPGEDDAPPETGESSSDTAEEPGEGQDVEPGGTVFTFPGTTTTAEPDPDPESAVSTSDPDDTPDGDHPAAVSTTNEEGTHPMSAPAQSGEITDLASAHAYVSSASQYCGQMTGTFDDAQAQAKTAADELRDQLGHLETAQSSLAGQGLDEQAARLGEVSEQFAALAQTMEQVESMLASTHDQLGAAQSTLDDSATDFESQQSIAEAVNSHRSVADNTEFYANA